METEEVIFSHDDGRTNKKDKKMDIASFTDFLVNDSKLSPNTARSYASRIKSIEYFTSKTSIGIKRLYSASSIDEIAINIEFLLSNDIFMEYSKEQHNSPAGALKKYYEYLTGNEIVIKNSDKIEIPVKRRNNYEGVDFTKYKELLDNEYRKGFRLNDKLSIRRFRMLWKKSYGIDLTEDDNEITDKIIHITIQHGNLAYLPENMLDSEAKHDVLAYINDSFNNGVKAIYYDALYKEFETIFVEQRINNAEMLKTYLSYYQKTNFYLKRNYIVSDQNTEIDVTEEVKNYLVAQATPMTIDEISNNLPHIPKEKLRWALTGHNSYEFVRNQAGEYFHAEIVDIKDDEIEQIIEWIKQSISEKKYMGGKELTDRIESFLPDIVERNPYLTWLGLRDVLAFKIKDRFSFQGKIISDLESNLSMSDIFAEFSKSHRRFTLDQLNILKNELDTPIYFDAVYENALRINKEEFVAKEEAKFDIEGTDIAIERYCEGEFCSINEIMTFGSFPFAHFPWNRFLLQNYVAKYSKKFKLVHTGFNAGVPVGAIVRKTIDIENFDDVLARCLAERDDILSREDALTYFCEIGLLARRSYGSIENVLVKANVYRTQKGN